MSKILNVLYKQQIVGELIQENSGKFIFKYRSEWLKSPEAFPISISIPLIEDTFKDDIVRPFFSGLLPEGSVRDNVALKLGVSSKSDFKLIQYLCGDCAGSLVLSDPMIENYTYEREQILLDKLGNLLETYSKQPFFVDHAGVRISLAGAQEKLPIIYEANNFYIPKGAPSTHILKLPIHGYEFTVENEAFCLTLANLIGISSAFVEIVDICGRNYLLVERYDREFIDGKWETLHQEDMCQALAIPSENKYQYLKNPNKKSPNVQKIAKLINDNCKNPIEDMTAFIKQFIFNFYIKNRDAHGKNYSFLYRGSNIELAPLYDVLNTEVYPNLSSDMAMKIGKTYKAKDVREDNWDIFAKEIGVNPQYVRKLREEILGLMKAKTELAINKLFKHSVPPIILNMKNNIIHQNL